MDLAELDTVSLAEAGAVMQVRHPVTDAPLATADGHALTLTLAGRDSERYRRLERAATNRRLKSARRGTVTAEEIEAEALDMLVGCTLAWSGIVIDGQALDCTPENVRRAYTRLPWLREQADAFVADRGNFSKASQAT